MTDTSERRIILTKHAIKRYQERVKPALMLEQAESELRRLTDYSLDAGMPITTSPPFELTTGNVSDETQDAFLMISDGVCLALRGGKVRTGGWLATTLFTRGGKSEGRRKHDKRERKARRWKKHLKSQMRGNRGKRWD
jgi:hypothetical protein